MLSLTFCSAPAVLPLRPRTIRFRSPPRCCCSTILSWNVNSLRALLRKNPSTLSDLVRAHSVDVLCLQETKLQESHEPLFDDLLPGYHAVFNSSRTRLGYSGTATYSLIPPLTIQRYIRHSPGDDEGRMVETVFSGVTIVNVYTMNSGANLKRLQTRLEWDRAFRKHLRNLRRLDRPIVVMGDLNVARSALDVYDEQKVQGLAGFSKEEKGSFEDFLEVCDMVDLYRETNPQGRDFTFWDYRGGGVKAGKGWRIDYALCSADMRRAVHSVTVLKEVTGSDHCPVLLKLKPGLVA